MSRALQQLKNTFSEYTKNTEEYSVKRSATEPLLHLLTSRSFGSCWFVVASLLKLVKVHNDLFSNECLNPIPRLSFYYKLSSSSYTMLKPAHMYSLILYILLKSMVFCTVIETGNNVVNYI